MPISSPVSHPRVQPPTETQLALVETMAVSRWRQMRIWALERATLQSTMEAHDPNEIDPATRVALSFRNLADDSHTLDLLHRYETRFDRQFARSLNLLIKLGRPDGGAGVSSCGTAPHPGPESESRPEDAPPLCDPSPVPPEDFCQTNPSGGDLSVPEPAGSGAEDAAGLEAEDAMELAPDNDFCQTNLSQFRTLLKGVAPNTPPVLLLAC